MTLLFIYPLCQWALQGSSSKQSESMRQSRKITLNEINLRGVTLTFTGSVGGTCMSHALGGRHPENLMAYQPKARNRSTEQPEVVLHVDVNPLPVCR
jgi:hypothetical protein